MQLSIKYTQCPLGEKQATELSRGKPAGHEPDIDNPCGTVAKKFPKTAKFAKLEMTLKIIIVKKGKRGCLRNKAEGFFRNTLEELY